MILIKNVCKVCCEPIDISKAVDNVVGCRFCGASYSVQRELAREEVTIRLAMADTYMESCKFDEAKEAFLAAAKLDGKDATAYFGAALAEFGVQYLPQEAIVNGALERKLIPISHRYTIDESILENKYYLKALDCASPEQKRQFEQEAGDIEHIRKQFLKHKKSGLYFDAFICVKVTDPNNEEHKTQDSIFAYKVYDMLKEKGYSPFYSEKSIGPDCGGTYYEAMILYALHCSRCMVIVCFNKEYLDSPWVKNEYRRYISLMRDDRKPEQSLVFVYDKEVIDRVPGIPGAIQSLNKNDGMSFNPGLMRFIEKNCRTLDKKAVAEIEFKKVQSGEVAAKAKRVEGAEINYAQLGSIEISQLTPDEENRLNIANIHLRQGMFDDAAVIFNGIITKNPRNQQAYWGRILCSAEAKNEEELAARIDKFNNWEDFKLLISLSDKKSANNYVERFMNAAINYTAGFAKEFAKEQKSVSLVKNLIIYKTDGWDKFFAEMKRIAIEKLYAKLLDLLLEYVDRSDVDEYIRIYNDFGSRNLDSKYDNVAVYANVAVAEKYFDKTLALDEGDGKALLCKFRITNKCGNSKEYIFTKESALTDFTSFDILLKFSGAAAAKSLISDFIRALLKAFDSGNVPVSGHFKEAFDRIIAINITDKKSGKAVIDEKFLAASFLKMSEICLKSEEFALAEYYFALALKYGKNDPRAYWGMLKAKLRAKDNDDLVNSNVDISKLPEYESALVCGDDSFRGAAVDVRKKQKEQLPRTLARKQALLDKFSQVYFRSTLVCMDDSFRGAAVDVRKKQKEQLPRTLARKQALLDKFKFSKVGFSEEELNFLNGPHNMRELDRLAAIKQNALEIILKKEADERKRIEKEKALERTRIEKEKALERVRIENEKAFERERMAREQAALKEEMAAERERKAKRKRDIINFSISLFMGMICAGLFALSIFFWSVMAEALIAMVIISAICAIILLGVQLWLIRRFLNGEIGSRLGYAVTVMLIIGLIALKFLAAPGYAYHFNFEGGVELGEYYGNKTEIIVPRKVLGVEVVEITDRVFNGNTGLKSITIPDSVTSIEWGAFRDCTSLTSITIPDSVTFIGTSAFEGCTSLTSITIPDSVTLIGDSVFAGCTSLASITIPDSVTAIGDSVFAGCTGLESITIPDSVTEIGKDAFKGCTGLTSITIPNSVTEIGDSFAGCTGLKSITIPDSVTEIGGSVFKGCTGLTSITIPDSVTEIGGGAFYECTGLKTIVIGKGVTYIGADAFSYCSKATSVYLTSAIPPRLGENWSQSGLNFTWYRPFSYANENRKVYVPAASLEAYKRAEGWTGHADKIVAYHGWKPWA